MRSKILYQEVRRQKKFTTEHLKDMAYQTLMNSLRFIFKENEVNLLDTSISLINNFFSGFLKSYIVTKRVRHHKGTFTYDR